MSLSKYVAWKSPFYNLRGREVTFMNVIHTAHDLFCGCDDPILHTLACMFFPTGVDDNSLLQEKLDKLKTLKINKFAKQLCLTTSEDTEEGTHGDVADPDILDHIDTGDLEELFAEDFEENSTGDG